MTIESVKNQTVEILVALPAMAAVKVPAAFILASTNWLFGLQNRDNMLMVMALVCLDLISAIIAEFKVGNSIESRKALKTVTKTVVYGIMIAGAHLSSKVTHVEFVESLAVSFLALTELISILENIGKMGYVVPNKLLNKLTDLRDQ